MRFLPAHFSSLSRSFWMALSCSASPTPPRLVSPARWLRTRSARRAGHEWMLLKRTGPSTDPLGYTASYWSPTRLGATEQQPLDWMGKWIEKSEWLGPFLDTWGILQETVLKVSLKSTQTLSITPWLSTRSVISQVYHINQAWLALVNPCWQLMTFFVLYVSEYGFQD